MVGTNYLLPKNVENALQANPQIGVCVVFKNDKLKTWASLKCNDSEFFKHKIAKMVDEKKFSDFEHEFVIIDFFGNVCYSNTDAKVQINKNGIVCVGENEYFVKPVFGENASLYVGAETFEKLNKKIKNLVSMKRIQRPQGFGKSGFEAPSTGAQME